MKRTFAALLGALILGLGGAAQAAIVYDNGGPNQVSGNEMSQWVQTEDFTLTATTTISDVHFWSVDSGLFDGSIVWQIYADNGGQPGALTASGSVSGAGLTRTFTGNTLFFGRENENSFFIPQMTLGAGIYHLGLHNGALSNTTRQEFYWETTSTTFGTRGWEDQAPFGAGTPQWFNNGQEHAFNLTNDGVVQVPEPATLALLGLGLAGLGFARRRKAS